MKIIITLISREIMITLISLTTIISGSVFFTAGFYIFLSWKKKKEEFLLQTFATFLLSLGFQMLFLTLGLAVFFDDNLMSSISWWLAHMFNLVGMGSLILLPIRIKFPTKEKLLRKIVISYIVIGSLIHLLNLLKIVLFKTPENIINWIVPGVNIAVIVVLATLSSLFSAYTFLSESFRMENRLMKLRSICLALGIVIFFIGGPMHNFITSAAMAAVAASLSILGVFLILAGIYIPIIFKQPPRESFPKTKF